MMGHVFYHENRIKDCVAKQSLVVFKRKVDILLFDVTTLYFESTDRDELRNFGFSKDCKFNQTQVVLALMTTTDGTPVGYELFPGNISEDKTLIRVIESVKARFDPDHAVLVADCAIWHRWRISRSSMSWQPSSGAWKGKGSRMPFSLSTVSNRKVEKIRHRVELIFVRCLIIF